MAQEIATVNSTKLTLLDDKLLQAAEQGLTGEQMHRKYGIPAAEAVVRVKQLLASQDVWTLIERKKLVINSMMRLKVEFDKYIADIPTNRNMAATYIRLMESIATRLDKETQFTDEEIEKVSNAQKRTIITAVETGYYSVRDYLKDYHPEVDLVEVDTAFRVGLQEGFLEVE